MFSRVYFITLLHREFCDCSLGKIAFAVFQALPYSGYNLRGTIFANHQISHVTVIFAIKKFANHCMYRVTFCVARSIYAPVAY